MCSAIAAVHDAESDLRERPLILFLSLAFNSRIDLFTKLI